MSFIDINNIDDYDPYFDDDDAYYASLEGDYWSDKNAPKLPRLNPAIPISSPITTPDIPIEELIDPDEEQIPETVDMWREEIECAAPSVQPMWKFFYPTYGYMKITASLLRSKDKYTVGTYVCLKFLRSAFSNFVTTLDILMGMMNLTTRYDRDHLKQALQELSDLGLISRVDYRSLRPSQPFTLAMRNEQQVLKMEVTGKDSKPQYGTLHRVDFKTYPALKDELDFLSFPEYLRELAMIRKSMFIPASSKKEMDKALARMGTHTLETMVTNSRLGTKEQFMQFVECLAKHHIIMFAEFELINDVGVHTPYLAFVNFGDCYKQRLQKAIDARINNSRYTYKIVRYID